MKESLKYLASILGISPDTLSVFVLVIAFWRYFFMTLNIMPHILSNYATKDNFTFIEEIKQLNTYGKFLIYFDVTSLFTNITLEETINITIDTIFENYPNIKFTSEELQKLFKIATSDQQ